MENVELDADNYAENVENVRTIQLKNVDNCLPAKVKNIENRIKQKKTKGNNCIRQSQNINLSNEQPKRKYSNRQVGGNLFCLETYPHVAYRKTPLETSTNSIFKDFFIQIVEI